MCLYIKNPRLKVATKDLLVFKIVKYNNSKIFSYYQYLEYIKDNTYTSDMRILDVKQGEYSHAITEGLHSYNLNIHQSLEDNIYPVQNPFGLSKCLNVGNTEANSDYYVCVNPHNILVGLFKIPIGSLYYTCDGCYVSDHLVCLGEYYTFDQWIIKRMNLLKYGLCVRS